MSLRFVQVTDHHLGSGPADAYFGYATAWAVQRVLQAIADASAHGAQFLLCTGDLVAHGTDEEYAFAREVFGVAPAGRAPGPLVVRRPGLEGLHAYFVPGNHDPRAALIGALFPESPPAIHLDVSWDVAGLAFVYLDLGTGGRAGVLREASLALLDEVLARGRPTVLVLHHHPVEVGIPWLDRALPEGVQRLWDRLAGGQVLAVLFGHAHASVRREVHGVPVFGLRSTSFQFAASEAPAYVIQPLHYRVLTVEGGRLRSQLYEIPLQGPAVGRPLP